MQTLDEIVEIFELLDDWDQRYAYIIELGEALPVMPAQLKTEDNRVQGCMSQVWVAAYSPAESPDKINFHGDCDTSVIKGVLALLIQLTEGKSADEIENLDIDNIFERLQLFDHLSPNRHVGIYAVVELMKKQTRELSIPSSCAASA